MGDMNHKPIKPAQDQMGDELERMLDATLAKYAAVEPRAGIEERVLANLRSEQARAARYSWWQWSLVATLAVIVVVTIALVSRWRAQIPPVISNKPTFMKPVPVISPHTARQSSGGDGPVKRATIRGSRAQRSASVVAAVPRLDQFPSPQPLTAEEVALAQYVRDFPKEARLVAEAQQEFEFETEKQMNDAGAQIRPSASIEQER